MLRGRFCCPSHFAQTAKIRHSLPLSGQEIVLRSRFRTEFSGEATPVRTPRPSGGTQDETLSYHRGVAINLESPRARWRQPTA